LQSRSCWPWTSSRHAGRGRASLRSAAVWACIWIGFGLVLGGWVAVRFGADAAFAYLTAFTLEKSLSVDNLFVFVLILSAEGSAVSSGRPVSAPQRVVRPGWVNNPFNHAVAPRPGAPERPFAMFAGSRAAAPPAGRSTTR
jgi:hypothetical protein